MKKQFVVIGLGRFGTSVAQSLCQMGYDVLAIDSQEEKVQDLLDCVTHAIVADATDEKALKALGLHNFDVVIVAIGKDIQASIMVTVTLKEMGVKYVLAKAQNAMHGKVLEKTGADRVVFPERDMGNRVARHLVAANIVDYIELAPDYSIVEIEAPPNFSGKTLRQLELRQRYGITALAIKKGKKINVSPGADDSIEAGDIMVVVGSNKQIQKLELRDENNNI